MEWLAVQPYYKMQREVTYMDQKNVVSERMMYLYEDRIVTQYREFPIQDVYDMSYRRLGSKRGLLYLHTSKGVFSYTVKEDPAIFIKAFKETVKK